MAGVDPGALVVHTVGNASSEILDALRAEGVTVRGVEPFDRRSPHCNKIAGALRMAEDDEVGPVVLCDTDTVFLEDPRSIAVPSDRVAGKLVDAPVPPLDIVTAIFDAAGLDLPPVVPLPWRAGLETVAGNFNGGLYVVPGPLIPMVASGWSSWARWLLDRRPLLRQYAVYVDQVAMALCLADLAIEPLAVAPRWNTPVHDPSNLPDDGIDPAMIHYHQEVDRRARIRSVRSTGTDRALGVVNRAVGIFVDAVTPDATYRDWLERSGLRAAPASAAGANATALGALIGVLHPESILDVGGDGPKGLAHPPWGRVTWVDGSDAADLGGSRADLVVCLDALRREPDPTRYLVAIRGLWAASGRAFVVAGYEEPPDLDDRLGHFHEPLSTTLRHVAPDGELYRIVTDGPTATFAVLRDPADRHPRDFGPSTLDQLVGRHPDQLGLALLRVHARTTTTFYPDHAPRLWEYPTVAGLMTAQLEPGSALVDVGAGVTPLAPFLSSRGYVVDTVDPSSVRRPWPPAPDWNEWDFLDYGAAGLAHRSWNCELEALPGRMRFDGIYSVSVIEHIPAADRRRLLAEMSARLRRGGLVVVTIDLVRDGDALWNRNLGIEVEDPRRHGTLLDVVEEARLVGLELAHRETVRGWGDVDVDIGLLAFSKGSLPWQVWVRRSLGRWKSRPAPTS